MNADAVQNPSQDASSSQSSELPNFSLVRFSAPYIVLLLSQLPLFAVYVLNLWNQRTHYRFLPFLVIVIAWLAWSRWPRKRVVPIVPSLSSKLFLALGVLVGAAAPLFLNPQMAAFATCCFLTAWLARVKDNEHHGSLLKVGLLSFLGFQLPLGYDVLLIQYMQRLSAQFSSRVLELFGQLHDLPGTVLVFPGKTYFVEEACSGVQSLFTLLFCAGAYGVINRYSFPRLGILVVIAACWALLMNSIRIMAIPMAEIHLGIDLVHGWKHEFLGYSALTIALLLLMSADRFLSIFFQPVHLDDGSTIPLHELKSNLRKSRALGWLVGSKNRSRGPANPLAVSSTGRIAVWTFAIIFIGLSIVQAVDMRDMLSKGQLSVRFFTEAKIVELEEGDLPVQIGSWTCTAFSREDRDHSSELGAHSDSWQYRTDGFVTAVSLDQPFPGWHELSKCYTNVGWKKVSRKAIDAPGLDGENSWPFIEVEFTNNTGDRGLLLFSFFDSSGRPFDSPEDWDLVTSLYHRVRNRLNPRIRSEVYQSETYQAQIFVSSNRDLTAEEINDIREKYLQFRLELRNQLLNRLTADQT